MLDEKTAAILALRVYDAGVAEVNRPLTQAPWVKLTNPLSVQDGFAYGVFRNEATNEVVISYRGTDKTMGPDGVANIGAYLGIANSQVIQAAKVYAQVLKDHGPDITFTGHSLGGGLASLMAVFFDRPAVVFDPAPFQAVAENIYAVMNIKDSLQQPVPAAFAEYDIARDLAARERNVASVHAVGEFLEALRTPSNTISGVDTPVRFGNDFMGPLGGVAMHSQLLLTAGLVSDSFRAATVQLPASLPLILSKSFYSQEPENSSTRNFLVDLLRSEQAAPGSGKLSHFAADLKKLGTDLAGLNRAAQDAMVAQGIEWYYWQGTDYNGQEFFTTAGGALQYTTARGADLPGAQNKAMPYVMPWLYNLLAASAVQNSSGLANGASRGLYQQWTVASASGATTAAQDAQKTQAFIGGSGADSYTGGQQADLLLGGDGSDTLAGGAGGDRLYGGAGIDSYLFEGQFGNDAVWDADGQGLIQVGGQVLGQANGAGKRNVWSARLEDGRFLGLAVYGDSSSSTGHKLVITPDGSVDSSVTVNNFDLTRALGDGGYLGIKLGGTRVAIAAKGAAAVSTNGNPFEAWDFDPQTFTGSTTTSNGKGFTVYLSQAATAGSTLVLRLGDLAGRGIKAILGDEVVDADGASIALTEGQTEVSFALKEGEADIAADVTGLLSVAYQDEQQTSAVASNAWTLTWKAMPEAAHTFTGDFVKKRAAGSEQYLFDEYGNYVADGAQADAHDLIRGTAQADTLAAGGGNDVLGGGDGDDLLDGGDGVDILLGGLGADLLLGGASMDILMGSAPAAFASPGNDDWRVQLPVHSDYPYLAGQGFNWHLKFQGNPASAGWPNAPFLLYNIIPEQLAGDAGNEIDAGAGDDIVYAGTGDDLAKGGDGRDLVYGMAGDDVLEGDDDDDILLGDGPTARGGESSDAAASFAPFRTPAERHGADFLDGGAGNDQLAGQGGGDDLFGGAGDDMLWGDDFEGSPVDGVFHGDDYLDGEDGQDRLYGGGKSDILYGGAGDDEMWGDVDEAGTVEAEFHGDDYLDGEAGNDVLRGGGRNDTLFGGAGNDTLWGDDSDLNVIAEQLHGLDYLAGEDGDDKLVGGANADELFGGPGNDVLRGDSSGEGIGTANASDAATHGGDYLDGEEGDDVLIGEGGRDTLYGSGGNDTLIGDDVRILAGAFHAQDYLDGEAGDDTLEGGGADDALFGGAGNDQLRGDGADVAGQYHGADYLEGEEGDDTIVGDGGDDTLYGGSGDDGLLGDSDTLEGQFHGQDFLDGADGNDVLYGGGGADVLTAGPGNDQMHGDSAVQAQYHGADDLDGGEGDDTLVGGGGDDVIKGGAGSDSLFGDGDVDGAAHGSDIIDGGDGDDSLVGDGAGDLLAGGSGNDRLWGGDGADRLDGGEGNDWLEGGAGDDTLGGGAGDDVLVADGGDDILYGGDGFDQYLIRGGIANVTVLDAAARDLVNFGAGLSLEGATALQQDDTVYLVLAGGATLTVHGDPMFRIGNSLVTGQQLVADLAAAAPNVPAAGQPGTTIGRTDGTGGHGTESFGLAGSTGVTYQADGGHTAFVKGVNGQETARYYTWDARLVSSSVTQTHGFNSITTYLDAAGAKLGETWAHADGSTGANELGSSDLRFNGMQNVLRFSAARTAPNPRLEWETENAWEQIWHDGDDHDFGVYWKIEGLEIGGQSYLSGEHDFEAVNGQPAIGFSDIWAGDFRFEADYVPYPFAWWDTLADYSFMDRGAGVEIWGELSRTRQKSVQGRPWVNGTQGPTSLLASASPPQTPTETTMQGANGYVSLIEDGLGNAIFTSFGSAGEPRALMWFHNDGSHGLVAYQPDGSSHGVTANPQGTLFSFTTDPAGDVQFAGHPGAETVWRDRFVEAPPVAPLAPPASLTAPPPSSYAREPYQRVIPDGKGGFVQLDYSWTGTVTKTHLGADGSITGRDYVDTDPGYGVSVAAAGAIQGWTYDYAGMPVSRYVRTADGKLETYTYDRQGRQDGREVAMTEADGKVTTRRFDRAGNLTGFSIEAASASGVETRHYDAGGTLTGTTLRIAGESGNSVTSSLDAAGALKSFTTTIATGAVETTTTTYNAAGIPTLIWVTSVSPEGLVQSHNYDAGGALIGSVLAQVEATGNSTTGFYGADGSLNSYVALASDAQSSTRVTTYDGQGRKTHEDTLQKDGVHIASGYEMDGSRLTTTVQPDGSFTTTARDREGDETTTIFSVDGLRISDSWRRGDGTSGSHVYAADGSSSGKTMYPDGSSSTTVTDAAGNSTTIHRSVSGPVSGKVVTLLEADTVRSTFYNAQGVQLKEVVTPLGVSGTPMVLNSRPRSAGMADQVASEDSAWEWSIGPDTFTDPDAGDPLSYTARLATGAALPGWLSFEGATLTFSGTPANDDVGQMQVQVTATDSKGAAVSDTFELTVQNVNDAPMVVNPVRPQSVTEDRYNWYAILYPDTFADVDRGDSLTLSMTLEDGSPLPAWLRFVSNYYYTYITGTPRNEDVGTLRLKWTATDRAGASASTTFTLTVHNLNDKPVANGSIAPQETAGGEPFLLTLPDSLFVDVDRDDVLAWSVTREDGTALPAWLSFVAATRTLGGTPGAADAGPLSLLATVTDLAGATASVTLSLNVKPGVAPLLAEPLADQQAVEDQEWAFTVPTGAFISSSPLQVLTYSATLPEDGPLPGWLVFDAVTRTFHGRPGNAEVGSFVVKVTAAGPSGARASDEFELQIANTNDAPIAAVPVDNQTVLEDSSWQFTVPEDSFTDVDVGDQLVLSAALTDGAALPAWLGFDPSHRTISGVPSNQDVGTVRVQLAAADAAGAMATSTFELQVLNTNDAPVVAQQVGPQQAAEDEPWTFTVPAAAFEDVDVGDALELSARCADGSPLPDWVRFDSGTRAFSGTPLNEHVGTVRLLLAASDSAGATASQQFDVIVANTNDAPTVARPPSAQDLLEDEVWAWSVPSETFLDVDLGDQLTFGASLLDGGDLPPWLEFDAATATFSGTPLNEDVGATLLRLTATDPDGASASTAAELRILNTNDAPVAVGAMASWSVRAESAVSLTLPRTSFVDPDVGDTMKFGADLADATPLQAWLRFDPASLTLSGTPAREDAGISTLRVTATDSGGASAAHEFQLKVGAIVIGGDRKDRLDGTAGDDLIDGHSSADEMAGMAGDDLYLVDSAGDVVIEAMGQGYDIVQASITYALAAHVEELVLVENADVNAIGNDTGNVLRGNPGENQLRGEAGDDTLDGGGGNDRVEGGRGNDVYLFGRGYGHDTVVEDDATSGGADTVLFDPGVNADQLWFRREGAHLEISISGTSDALLVQHWFKDPAHRVEVFRTSDGRSLLESQVQGMVDAMAAFSPPAAGQTTLPESYRQVLGGVIAVNWAQAG